MEEILHQLIYRYNILLFTGFYTSQVVLFHQQYDCVRQVAIQNQHRSVHSKEEDTRRGSASKAPPKKNKKCVGP